MAIQPSAMSAWILCRALKTVRIQNPAEIIYPVKFFDEEFFLSANFAYFANNHFTLFNKEHRPQL